MSKYKNAYLELADLFDELNAHYNALVKKQTETKPLVRRKIPSLPVESVASNKLIEDLKEHQTKRLNENCFIQFWDTCFEMPFFDKANWSLVSSEFYF